MIVRKEISTAEQEAQVEAWIEDLSLDEKVFMCSGHGFLEHRGPEARRYCEILYPIGAGNERLEIPHFLFNDGPRGIAKGNSTCFPVPMARGATFDVDLERRIGDAIGRELRAHGGNLFGGVCINLLRHPAWGRAQETYGEDPFLLGEMGVALTRGVQHHNVVATPKHFAANSMENARFHVDVSVDERALREVYLPHFKRCIDAGAGAVMSAYNKVNGTFCGHSYELLTRILKEEWGFDGFVYSDFILGCREAGAFDAGLDVEAPDTIHFGEKLSEKIRNHEIEEERLDDAVRRVLRSLLKVSTATDPEIYSSEVIACADHVALAREVAEKSLVLLKNDHVLPLETSNSSTFLVLGVLATTENTGDHGSSHVYPPDVVTPLEGLREGAPEGCQIIYDQGDDLERVAGLAKSADHVLVVAGFTHADEGEYIPGEPPDAPSGGTPSIGGDRVDLRLGETQEALIRAAAQANPKTVVAVMAGSAVIVEAWAEEVAGILLLWYPGMQGGHALADVVFGRVNPSGRLPFSMPKSAQDLPFFNRDAFTIHYDLWHGYTKLDHEGIEPAYPFGFGLSYTDIVFERSRVELDQGTRSVRVEVSVRNTGMREGTAVVQVYAGPDPVSADHPVKRLCGFTRVPLASGETRRVALEVALRDLAFYDVAARCWRLEGDQRIFVGSSSAEVDLLVETVSLSPKTWDS